MQTLFSGVHPEGMEYKNNGKRPATVRFEDIVWPDGITLPGTPKPAPASGDSAGGKRHSCHPGRQMRTSFHGNRGGSITVNQSYFIQRFCLENLVLFEFEEGWFFVYSDDNGAWARSAGSVKEMFKEYWEHLCNTCFASR